MWPAFLQIIMNIGYLYSFIINDILFLISNNCLGTIFSTHFMCNYRYLNTFFNIYSLENSRTLLEYYGRNKTKKSKEDLICSRTIANIAPEFIGSDIIGDSVKHFDCYSKNRCQAKFLKNGFHSDDIPQSSKSETDSFELSINPFRSPFFIYCNEHTMPSYSNAFILKFQ